jgi:hypothetical protein
MQKKSDPAALLTESDVEQKLFYQFLTTAEPQWREGSSACSHFPDARIR